MAAANSQLARSIELLQRTARSLVVTTARSDRPLLRLQVTPAAGGS